MQRWRHLWINKTRCTIFCLKLNHLKLAITKNWRRVFFAKSWQYIKIREDCDRLRFSDFPLYDRVEFDFFYLGLTNHSKHSKHTTTSFHFIAPIFWSCPIKICKVFQKNQIRQNSIFICSVDWEICWGHIVCCHLTKTSVTKKKILSISFNPTNKHFPAK